MAVGFCDRQRNLGAYRLGFDNLNRLDALLVCASHPLGKVRVTGAVFVNRRRRQCVGLLVGGRSSPEPFRWRPSVVLATLLEYAQFLLGASLV